MNRHLFKQETEFPVKLAEMYHLAVCVLYARILSMRIKVFSIINGFGYVSCNIHDVRFRHCDHKQKPLYRGTQVKIYNKKYV